MRGSRGRDHTPAALTYVGRLVVEKKPSGRTPSAGAGSKRASGAPPSGGASKWGGRYWNRGRVVTGTLIIRGPNPVTQRPLQKRDRVAIDDHRTPGPRAQGAHDATDRAWLRGFHEHVPAPAPLEPLDGARRRPEHAERAGEPLGIGPDEPRRHALGRPLGTTSVLVRGHEPRQPDVRRVRRIGRGPQGQLGRDEPRHRVDRRGGDGVMIGPPGLDVYPASLRPASGPARHLCHELESPLGRAEVW